MESTEAVFNALTETAIHYPDLCPALSRPLVNAIADRLPQNPALVLSVGCGSGLLEAMILRASQHRDANAPGLNLVGVEVPDCSVTHLPADRTETVPTTLSLVDDAVLASTLMFVYPRQPTLIAMYLDATVNAALEQIIWLGHRNDWREIEPLFLAAFYKLERIDGSGVAPSEILVIATMPRRRGPQQS